MSQETRQAGWATPKDNVCPASTGHDLKKMWILSPIASAARQRHARVSFEAAIWRGVWNLVNVALPKQQRSQSRDKQRIVTRVYAFAFHMSTLYAITRVQGEEDSSSCSCPLARPR